MKGTPGGPVQFCGAGRTLVNTKTTFIWHHLLFAVVCTSALQKYYSDIMISRRVCMLFKKLFSWSLATGLLCAPVFDFRDI